MLFVLKLTITPLLVAAMSLAARRWGPAVGGLIMGLPWMTGPVLFLLTIEKGLEWAFDACIGALMGVVGIAFYILLYGVVAQVAAWPFSLAAAATGFAAAGGVTSQFDVGLPGAVALGTASLLAVYYALPKPKEAGTPQPLPWWDIPARMIATAALVFVIATTADVLGPRLSGVVSTFPVILTVVGAFTHHNWGSAAVIRLFRGLLLSLLSFVVFFWVAGATITDAGLVQAYFLAGGAALTISGLLLALNRFRAKKGSD